MGSQCFPPSAVVSGTREQDISKVCTLEKSMLLHRVLDHTGGGNAMMHGGRWYNGKRVRRALSGPRPLDSRGHAEAHAVSFVLPDPTLHSSWWR